LSKIPIKKAPAKNPIVTGNHDGTEREGDISTAGSNSDQKLADIIIPAENPNIKSLVLFEKFLKRKTDPAPKAVILHVKSPARSA